MFNSYYDIDEEIKRERKRYSKSINSRYGYNSNAWGSAECSSSSWDSIYDAYNEYRANRDY